LLLTSYVRVPKRFAVDYGGTLVEEVAFDPRAGTKRLLAQAVYQPEHVRLEAIVERANKVSAEVAARRDQFQVETPWPTLTRLIYDFFGIRFAAP
jgi:hypothetical protein